MGLFRYPKLIIVALVLLTAGAAWFATRLHIVYNFDNLFPQDDPDFQFYRHFKNQIEPDDNVLFVAVHDSQGVFRQPLLTEAHRLTATLRTLPHVESAVSLTGFYNLVKTPFGTTRLPVLHWQNPERYTADSARIMQDERLVGKLISADAQTLIIVLKTAISLSQQQMETLNDSLFAALEAADLLEYHVAGRATVQTTFVRTQQAELRFYTLLSSLLVLAGLAWVFRRFWGVAVAYFSVFAGMVLFFGLLGLFRFELHFMSSLLPILMLIVGMSDVIHIFSKYLDEREQGRPRWPALRLTLREIGWATFLTSLTTAVGFAALVSASIVPIQKFGLTAAMGVFIAYATVILLTTSLLLLIPKKKLAASGKRGLHWERWLHQIDTVTTRYPLRILAGFAVMLAVAGIGIAQISTDANLRIDVPENTRASRDFDFFQKELGGFRPVEIAILPKGGHRVNDLPVLEAVDRLEQCLRDTIGLKGVYSPTTIYKTLHRAHNDNLPQFYRLPETAASLQRYERYLRQLPEVQLNRVMNDDRTMGRLTAKVRDIGVYAADSLRQQISGWVNARIDTATVGFRFNGHGSSV